MLTSGEKTIQLSNHDLKLKIKWKVLNQNYEERFTNIYWEAVFITGNEAISPGFSSLYYEVNVIKEFNNGSVGWLKRYYTNEDADEVNTKNMDANTERVIYSDTAEIPHYSFYEGGKFELKVSFYCSALSVDPTVSLIYDTPVLGSGLNLRRIPYNEIYDTYPEDATEEEKQELLGSEYNSFKLEYTYNVDDEYDKIQVGLSLGYGDYMSADIPYRDLPFNDSVYEFTLSPLEINYIRTLAFDMQDVKLYVITRGIKNGVAESATIYAKEDSEIKYKISNSTPTISPVVEDTNIETTYLTGDKTRFIRYCSNLTYNFNAEAHKEAEIVKCEVQAFNTYNYTYVKIAEGESGTINDIKYDTLKFVAEDSRGYKTETRVNLPLINYYQLTSNVISSIPTVAGDAKLTINGNYWSGSFGAYSNNLIVLYRYKEDGGEYGEWHSVNGTVKNQSYTATANISGLDYKKQYVVQARAADMLLTVDSAEVKTRTVPVFDWGESDFNFNVPVTATGYSLTGAAKALTNSYKLETNIAFEDVYGGGVVSLGNVYLLGNSIRFWFSSTRTSASGVGNITEEKIGTVTINHGGKIKAMYNVNTVGVINGGIAAFTMTNASNDGETISFDINLTATHAAGTSYGAIFTIPCLLNLDKY